MWRPISLLNADYKIKIKVLSFRIANAIEPILSRVDKRLLKKVKEKEIELHQLDWDRRSQDSETTDLSFSNKSDIARKIALKKDRKKSND